MGYVKPFCPRIRTIEGKHIFRNRMKQVMYIWKKKIHSKLKNIRKIDGEVFWGKENVKDLLFSAERLSKETPKNVQVCNYRT